MKVLLISWYRFVALLSTIPSSSSMMWQAISLEARFGLPARGSSYREYPARTPTGIRGGRVLMAGSQESQTVATVRPTRIGVSDI